MTGIEDESAPASDGGRVNVRRLGPLVGVVVLVGGFFFMAIGDSEATANPDAIVVYPPVFYLGVAMMAVGVALMLISVSPRGRSLGMIVLGSILLAFGILQAVLDWIGRGVLEAFDPGGDKPISGLPFIIGSLGLVLLVAGAVTRKRGANRSA